MLIPNGKYNGQKLATEVAINTIASIPKIIARTPEMTCVKYKVAIKPDIKMQLILSADPIFFFMSLDLIICYYLMNVLPGATIDHVRKAILFQHAFCLPTSATTFAEDNYISFIF